jgi:hypothetical protein
MPLKISAASDISSASESSVANCVPSRFCTNLGRFSHIVRFMHHYRASKQLEAGRTESMPTEFGRLIRQFA